MLDIRDDHGRTLATATTIDEAEHAMDNLCAGLHAQTAAKNEGTTGLWLHLTVIDPDGHQVAFRSCNPDPDTPYRALTTQDGT